MLDERLLFREALRLGLHRADPVVLRRLRQDVVFLGIQAPAGEQIQTALDMQLYQGDEVIRRRLIERMRAIARGPSPVPDDATLRQRYAQQAERWQAPPRFSLSHVYLRAGEQDQARAQRLRQRLVEGDMPLTISNSEAARIWPKPSARALPRRYGRHRLTSATGAAR